MDARNKRGHDESESDAADITSLSGAEPTWPDLLLASSRSKMTQLGHQPEFTPGVARASTPLAAIHKLVGKGGASATAVTSQRVERRLAAILAADVANYSRLMGLDEVGTLETLKAHRREVIDPAIAEHKGRIVKTTGDGMLVEFASMVDAVTCAIAIQEKMAERSAGGPEPRIRFRIGINVGEIIIDGDDILGDGVNVAARVENECEPGCVYVSGNAFEQIRGKTPFAFDDLGDRTLKNIERPVRLYAVRGASSPAIATTEALSMTVPHASDPLPLPDRPSIAVLPFVNMSSDPEQEVFADGLTDDLITDLSKTPGLFVIARNSTFAYKGKSVDIRRLARDLGVRYLLKGSGRRASGRVRINVQLIDAVDGGHLWAERFDRSVDDIFAVQDEITGKIVEALVGRLTAPPARKRPANMEAYDLCVRGRTLIGQSPQAAREARMLLERAIALDPGYAEAHARLALALWAAWTNWGEPMEPNRRMSVELAERAVLLDPDDAGNRRALGRLLAHERRWQESDAQFTAAIELDPNHADAWMGRAEISALGGQPAIGIEQAQRALRLNPHPPGWYYWTLGLAQYAARQYQSAVETLFKDETYRTGSRRILAATLAQLGRIDEARREAELFMVGNPLFTIGRWAESQPFRDEATRQHFIDGYRKAGLPE